MFARSFTRSFTNVGRVVQKRGMAGHAPPPQGGLDGIVRKYLPGNHHLSMGVIGLYFTLFLLSKITSGKKKAPEAVHSHAVSSSDGGMPSSDSAEFGDWLSGDGNIEKMLNSA